MFDPESFSKLSETYQQALRPRIEIRVLRAARCYICTNIFLFYIQRIIIQLLQFYLLRMVEVLDDCFMQLCTP